MLLERAGRRLYDSNRQLKRMCESWESLGEASVEAEAGTEASLDPSSLDFSLVCF